MIAVIARALAGPMFDWLKAMGENKVTREQLQAELEKHLASEASAVIRAEITGESWLQRNWRPIVALTSFFSYWFVIFPYPFLVTLGLLPFVRFGEVGLQNFFILTTICVGGYIGARTIEKLKR